MTAAEPRLAVFVDTSAWIALFKQKDPAHDTIARAWNQLRREGMAIVTSSDILDETYTRLRYDVGHAWAVTFHRSILDAVAAERLVVEWVEEGIAAEAWAIFEKFGDQALSFTDCTSAAICRRLKIPRVLTLDGDFRILGFEVLP